MTEVLSISAKIAIAAIVTFNVFSLRMSDVYEDFFLASLMACARARNALARPSFTS